jgi:hypothetical protein
MAQVPALRPTDGPPETGHSESNMIRCWSALPCPAMVIPLHEFTEADYSELDEAFAESAGSGGDSRKVANVSCGWDR